MSNTSTVTPYAGNTQSAGVETLVGAAALCVAGAGVAAVAAVKWLTECSPEEQAFHAQQRLREAQGDPMKHRVSAMNRMGLSSVELAMSTPDSLLQTARAMGFRLEYGDAALKAQQASLFPLVDPSGNRVLLEKTGQGRLVMHTAGGSAQAAKQLVRNHTVDAALRHFQGKGMQVHTQTLANGEMEIRAEESALARNTDGKAAVTTRIRQDGSVFMDVDRIKGSRCEQIVSEFAEAVGGDVVKTDLKSAYYQLPGEPVNTRQRL